MEDELSGSKPVHGGLYLARELAHASLPLTQHALQHLKNENWNNPIHIPLSNAEGSSVLLCSGFSY